MGKKNARPETVAFQLSAAVPLASIGAVLKALYDAGCPPSSFEMKAIVGVVGDGPPTHNDSVPAATRVGPTKARAEDIRQAMVAIMKDRHPENIQRKDLQAAVVERLGEDIALARLNTAATDLLKDKTFLSDGRGSYRLSAKVQKKLASSSLPAPSDEPLPPGIKPGSGPALAYRTFTADPSKVWTKEAMRDVFEAAGRAGVSAKGDIVKLHKQGVIEKIKVGHYQLAGRRE